MRTLGLVVAAGALVALFVGLGRWQLARAAEQRALWDAFAERASAPALAHVPSGAAAAEQRYRRVRIAGRYLPAVQVLLDNITHDGVAGYAVLTPFAVEPGDTVVLVNRGWVAASPYRNELPVVPVESDRRVVTGRIDTFPVAALELGSAGSGSGPLRVLSFPRQADLERELGRTIVAYQVLLDATEADGFVRAWSPSGPAPERNLAYAWQWFALGIATATGACALLLRPLIGRRRT